MNLCKIEQSEFFIKQLKEESVKNNCTLEDHTVKIKSILHNKTEYYDFKTHVDNYKIQIHDLMEYNEMSRNKVLSQENYLEKYQPLFTQRQIEEVLKYVLTSNKHKFKLKKFCDLKNDLFINKILADKGNPNLLNMAKEMRDQISAGELTNEEKELQASMKDQPKDPNAPDMNENSIDEDSDEPDAPEDANNSIDLNLHRPDKVKEGTNYSCKSAL